MTHADPAQGRASADAQDVKDELTATGGQDVRSFDDERYPPVNVAQWQRFPPSSPRGFAIASALGQYVTAEGGSERLRRGKDAAGSLVTEHRLKAVLEAIGVTDRTWRRYVEGWVEQELAHRCAAGRVCLFTKPLPDVCPGCQVELSRDHVPRARRRRPDRSVERDERGRFKPSGPLRSGVTDRNGPKPGRKRSATVAVNGPAVSTDAPHPLTGINGMEVGRSLPESSDDAAVPGASAVEELPRGRLQETAAGALEWISPFEDKHCPECRCWPHQGGHFAGCPRRTIREASA